MTKSLERGFTLIEMIIFLVVVSVAMAGLLQVMSMAVKFSALPLQRKQASAFAEGLLREMVQKDFSEIVTPVVQPSVEGLQALVLVSDAGILGSAKTSTFQTKKITVTVRFADQSLSLNGYRSNYYATGSGQ
jgi:prepilin-type N-terminal cleavage/methylation domain-containing protein